MLQMKMTLTVKDNLKILSGTYSQNQVSYCIGKNHRKSQSKSRVWLCSAQLVFGFLFPNFDENYPKSLKLQNMVWDRISIPLISGRPLFNAELPALGQAAQYFNQIGWDTILYYYNMRNTYKENKRVSVWGPLPCLFNSTLN